jgi:hypothetical protein
MDTIVTIVQIIIGLGILNVWLLRYNRSTAYRGGNARNMKEEFQVYGLPVWFMTVIGAIKVVLAVMLLAGVVVHGLTTPAAYGMAVLMLGAVAMHVKVRDPVKKALPALTVLVLSLFVAIQG